MSDDPGADPRTLLSRMLLSRIRTHTDQLILWLAAALIAAAGAGVADLLASPLRPAQLWWHIGAVFALGGALAVAGILDRRVRELQAASGTGPR